MSMLAMSPSPYPAFRNDFSWDGSRSPEYARPRDEPKTVALPSIRQAFPELLHLSTPSAVGPPRTGSERTSPNTTLAGPLTSPDYVHTSVSAKRRRLSAEDDQEAMRSRQVPRLYRSPDGFQQRRTSPTRLPRPAPTESWTPSRTSPYTPSAGLPTPVQIQERADYRPSLPSLPPPMALERDAVAVAAPMHRVGEGHVDGYHGPRHPVTQPPRTPIVEGSTSNYQSASYGYPFQQPSRYQSATTSSTRPYDRSPFTAGGYNQYHQDLARYGDVGSLSGETKQRKRRGNLPKETTDKLRSWFLGHLQHPYPTEDEKQELMRQTGLQMNQISNWFINARRRQLPTMINNAQAEHDAMTSRSGEKVLATTERSDYEHDKRVGLPLSDGEGGDYEEDSEGLKQRGVAGMKRGSI